MIQFSDITGITYNDEDCVFFRNTAQSAKYISWGAKLIDIFTDSKDILVFVFLKSDHKRFKMKWGSFVNSGGDKNAKRG